MDPRGLTYQRGDPSPDPSSKLDINIEGEWDETSDVDSHTTIQENPLKYRLHTARQNGEIQLETAVTPYNDNFHDYHDGNMRTFHVEENSSSDTSDSTGDSHKVLMEKHRNNPRGTANSLSWAGSNPPSSTFGSDVSTFSVVCTSSKLKIYLTRNEYDTFTCRLIYVFAEEINDDVLSLSIGKCMRIVNVHLLFVFNLIFNFTDSCIFPIVARAILISLTFCMPFSSFTYA
jgi:hypothetical protein